MLEGRNLWELTTKRAAATPDAVMTIDETDRAITYVEYRRRAERAAAGLATLARHRRRRRRLLDAADLARVARARGGTRPPGCGAEPDHPHLPRPGGGLRDRARPGSKLLIVPGEWRGFDYVAMAERIKAANGSDMAVLTVDRALPEGDPSALCATR